MTDPALSIEGVWVPWRLDIELKIASFNNPAFERALRRVTKPHKRRIATGDIDDEVLESLSKESVAKLLLLDWKNVQGEDGKDIPYSWEKALEFFNDERTKQLYRDVIAISRDHSLFMAQDEEDDRGN